MRRVQLGGKRRDGEQARFAWLPVGAGFQSEQSSPGSKARIDSLIAVAAVHQCTLDGDHRVTMARLAVTTAPSSIVHMLASNTPPMEDLLLTVHVDCSTYFL